MDNLVDEINRALRVRGWSAAKASTEAVGSPELIRDIRRGHLPTVGRLKSLCDVLELEFYVGRRRKWGAIDERRLEEAVASTERTLEANTMMLDPEAKASAIAAVYELLDTEREPATAARTKRLIEALMQARRGGAGETDSGP